MGRLALALRSLRGTLLTATDGRDVLYNSPDGWEVEQPWLWWTSSGGPFGNPIPGAGGAATFGNIPAVARATSLITDELAAMPWHVYRGDYERLTTPTWLADPQALRLDGRVVDASAMAEVRLSPFDFWAQWIQSALWFGDGFVYVPRRDDTGAPRPPLYVLNPADIDVRDGSYFVLGANEPFAPGEIIHLRGQLPIVHGRGTGALARFAAELGGAVAVRDYLTSSFSAGVPAGYLKTSAPNITQDQADRLKDRWMTQHGGRRSIAVLNATTEFHPLTWSPVEAGAADFAQLSLNQIALMFNEPAYVLGAPTDNNTYANEESRMRELYTMTWLPWIKRIEDTLDAQLPAGTSLRIVVDGVLRGDLKTRMEAFAIGIPLGVYTTDEARAYEGRPPLEEATA